MIGEAGPTGKRGRRPDYSGEEDQKTIKTCLTMTVLFGMTLGQTTRFVESLLGLIGPDWTVPNFGTLSRCQKTLSVYIPSRGSPGPLDLTFDSTGTTVEGKGAIAGLKVGEAAAVAFKDVIRP